MALTRGHPLALALVADLLARDLGTCRWPSRTRPTWCALVERFVGTTDLRARARRPRGVRRGARR
ncbi:MAG: hypothetical protein U1F43_32620 [Myxococcota bacterium]